ncbi:uncharacterized protein ABDE67_014025 [Symphorus nematophorus]
MDARQKKQASPSVKSDDSKDELPFFSTMEWNAPCPKTDRMDANYEKRPTSPTCLSLKSDRSRSLPPDFCAENTDERNPPCPKTDRLPSPTCLSLKSDKSRSLPPDFCAEKTDEKNVIPVAAQFPVGGTLAKTGEYDLALPSLIEDWTKEHVRDWLTIRLRVPQKIANNLYDQELSGAYLVSYEKQDLLELGVPAAPAIHIIRQVEKFRKHSEASSKTQNKIGNRSEAIN